METSAMLLIILVVFSAFYSTYGTPDLTNLNNMMQTNQEWGTLCETGRSQSPINIQTSAISQSNETYINFKNYNVLLSASIRYEEYTIKFDVKQKDKEVKLILGNKKLEKQYQLKNIHFHWGCTEHHFNNQSYSLEIHLVHSLQQNGTFDPESDPFKRLSVVALLFEKSEHENEILNTVLDMIRHNSTDRGLNKKSMAYRDLLPKDLDYIYQYSGSLTTTPCNETVLWSVIPKKNHISSRQILAFQKLHKKLYNCRSILPLNGRKIFQVSSIKFIDNASAIPFKKYEVLYLTIILIILIFY